MTPITTHFGFSSTAAEVAEGITLAGKRVIITGASSGIGLETARVLSRRPRCWCDVTLAVARYRRGCPGGPAAITDHDGK